MKLRIYLRSGQIAEVDTGSKRMNVYKWLDEIIKEASKPLVTNTISHLSGQSEQGYVWAFYDVVGIQEIE